MSVHVIVPAAGPGSNWLLRRPDGALVIETVLRELDLTQVASVVVVVRPSCVSEYFGGAVEAAERYLRQRLPGSATCAVTCLPLPHDTPSAAHTVQFAIERLKISGAIFVKDCDGAFPHKVVPENVVCGLRVTSANVAQLHDLPGKSFIEDCGSVLTNIAEKRMVSDVISVGGYGFESAVSFTKALREVESAAATAREGAAAGGRLFVSHLVLQLLLRDEVIFRVSLVDRFSDWKTKSAVAADRELYSNRVVTLEGGLLLPKPDWLASFVGGKPLSDQYDVESAKVATLVKEHGSGKLRIVLLSSQPEGSRDAVTAYLKEVGIPFDSLVLGLYGSKTTFDS